MSAQDQLNIDALAKQAFEILSDGEVTFGEIVQLGATLACKVNQFEHLSGLEKQHLVIKAVDLALKKILESLPSDDQEKKKKVELAASFAKETLPSVLNVVVDAARGRLDLKKPEVKKSCLSLVSLLFDCISRPKVQEPKKEIPSQEVQPKLAVEVQEAPKEKSQVPPEETSKELETIPASKVENH
jgi:hypothetical protein